MTDKTLGMICKEARDAYIVAHWRATAGSIDLNNAAAWEAAAQAVLAEHTRRAVEATTAEHEARISLQRQRNR